MPLKTSDAVPFPGALPRRSFLLASVAGALGMAGRADEPPALPDRAPADELAQILARAKAGGLRGFRHSETEHYLGVGNAPSAFRDQALKICRTLAAVYVKHFQDKGFAVKYPEYRLTVITLKDQQSYAAFAGSAPGANVGGHYDLDTNRLVVFDFRPEAADSAAAPERLNTFSLIHEALHQLTFNTGLLNRQGDVPLCISEGLAMYGELWQPPPRRSILGQVNKPRIDVIAQDPNLDDTWIPVERLLAQDRIFNLPATQQLAYAEAWVLVHYLMKTPARAGKFRDYLHELYPRRDATHRVRDAKAHFGDLTRLDRDVKHYANRMG